MLKKIVPSGNLQGMDTSKIKRFDDITTVFTKGEVNGKKIGDQGTAPIKVSYLEKQFGKKFSSSPTQWLTLIPTVYNADTLGIRPDLIGRPIEHWHELLNPEFRGKASLLNIPSIGIMDAAMVVESMGEHQYADKGNMTKARDRPDDEGVDGGEESRPVPGLLEGVQRVGEPDGLRRGGDPVDVVSRGDEGPLPGGAVHLSAAEGGLPGLGGRLRDAAHVEGQEARRGLRVHQLVPVGLGRRVPEPSGLLRGGAVDGQGEHGAVRVGVLDGR